MKISHFNPFVALVTAAFSLAATVSSYALTGTWTDITAGPNNWSNTTMWSGGTIADAATFTATFSSNITASTTVTLDTSRTIGNLTFSDNGVSGSPWVLAASGGSVLTLANGVSDAVITKTTDANISARLASTGTVSITGNQNLTLSGINTGLTGTVRLGGTNQIFITNSSALGSAGLIVTGQPAFSALTNDITLSNAVSFTSSGTSLFWTGNGGRSLNLGGTLTLNASNASDQGFYMWLSDLTQSGSVALGSRNLSVQGGNNKLIISGSVAGTGGITKTSSGLLVLSGNNTYSGTTRIDAGTVLFANGSLGTSTVNMNGGALQWSAGNTEDVSSRLTMVAAITATLNTGGNNVTLATGFGGGTTGSLAKTGAGTLTLSGANTYTGSTTVSDGTLALGFGAVSSNILSSSSALMMGGGTLQLTGTGTQTVNGLSTAANSASRILLGANQTLTLGALTSAGTASVLNFNTTAGGANATTSTIGTGLAILTEQTAGAVINSGFTVSDAGGFGLATVDGSNQVVRLTTGTLLPATSGTSTTDYRIDNNAGGGAADGSSSLAITASQSAKSITVDSTTASGVLTLNSGVTLSNNIWNIGGNGSNTFQITGGTGLNSVSSGNAISINNYNTGNVTIASPILANGTNAVSVNGTGTTIFTGANAYTGGTTIGSGSTVLVGNGGATGRLGGGALLNNGTLTNTLVGASITLGGTGNITALTGSGSSSFSANSINFATVTGGAFSANTTGNQSYVTNSNNGGLVFTNGASTYNFTTSGGASITMRGDIGANSAPASGGAIINLDTSAGNGTINLDISVGRSGQFWNIGAVNANAGTGAINWTGTYGEVRGSNSSQSTPITLTGAINMSANFQSQTLQTLTMNATGISTVTGALRGTVALVKGGTERLTLSGANTFTGATTINQGILEIGGSGTLGGTTYAGNVSIGQGATLAFNSSATQTLSGIISSPTGAVGNLTKAGGGTLTLSGANTYSGGTTFNAGVIRVSTNDTALGTGTLTVTTPTTNGSTTNLLATASGGGNRTLTNSVVIANNGIGVTTLQLDGGFGNLNLSGNISGNGRIQTTSSGTVRLTGTNTYTGSTELTGTNTLVLSGSNTTSGISVGSGTTLALRLITLSSTQNITGAGNVTKDISFFGASSIAGTNNNYTGSTVVNIDRFTLDSGGVINGTSSISVLGQFSAEFLNLGSVTTVGAVTVNGSSAASDGLFNNGNIAGTTPGSLTAASISLQSSFISHATNLAHGGEFNNRLNSTVNLGSGAITVNGQGNTLAGGSTASGSAFNNAGSVTAGSITLNSSSTANTASNKGGTYTQTGGSTALSSAFTLAANGGSGAAGTAGNDAAFNLSGGTFSAASLAVNSGTVTATGGTLTLGAGGITSTGANTIAVNLGATTVGASAAWTSSTNMALTDTSTGTTFNTLGGNIGLSGELSGSGKLVKSNNGTLTLSGTNIYTGATNVNAGILAVNGNQSVATGVITVASGATLKGTGSVGGATTLQTGGILNAGAHSNNSPTATAPVGKQTFSSDLTLNSQSIFAWDLSGEKDTATGTRGSDFDAVDVSGSLSAFTAAGTPTPASDAIFRVIVSSAFDFTTPFWNDTRTWSNIFTVAGTINGWANSTAVDVNTYNFASNTYNTANPIIEGAFTISGTTLTWSAVPEPTSALAGLLIGAGLLRRRR